MTATQQAIEVRDEIVMGIINITGHSYNKAEWAKYLLDMYGKALEKKDRGLWLMLNTIVGHEKCVMKITERFVEQDEESFRIFVKHLGAFFNTLRRANPDQKGEFFIKLDDLQQEFSEAVNGKEGRVI